MLSATSRAWTHAWERIYIANPAFARRDQELLESFVKYDKIIYDTFMKYDKLLPELIGKRMLAQKRWVDHSSNFWAVSAAGYSAYHVYQHEKLRSNGGNRFTAPVFCGAVGFLGGGLFGMGVGMIGPLGLVASPVAMYLLTK